MSTGTVHIKLTHFNKVFTIVILTNSGKWGIVITAVSTLLV